MKSSIPGVTNVDQHCVKRWSRTQNGVGTPSAEGEVCGAVKASCEAVDLHTVMQGLGQNMDVTEPSRRKECRREEWARASPPTTTSQSLGSCKTCRASDEEPGLGEDPVSERWCGGHTNGQLCGTLAHGQGRKHDVVSKYQCEHEGGGVNSVGQVKVGTRAGGTGHPCSKKGS